MSDLLGILLVFTLFSGLGWWKSVYDTTFWERDEKGYEELKAKTAFICFSLITAIAGVMEFLAWLT